MAAAVASWHAPVYPSESNRAREAEDRTRPAEALELPWSVDWSHGCFFMPYPFFGFDGLFRVKDAR